MRLKIVRTSSENPDFRELVGLLDAELAIRDGADHSFFAQYNKLDTIRNVVVGFLGEKAVGCGAFKRFDYQTVEIKRMFVRFENRGKGVAAEILQELERWAVELKYNSAVLETGKNQPEAIRLYQKSFYEIIPNYGQYVGVELSVCMKKRLF